MSDKTVIDGRQVEVVRTTKHKADGQAFEMGWTLDFENVTDEQLLELATRSVVIGIQRKFRDAKGKPDDWNGKTFDVAELLNESRKREKLDPMEAARRLLAGMSEADREAVLAGLED